jgi:hypothetical protein
VKKREEEEKNGGISCVDNRAERFLARQSAHKKSAKLRKLTLSFRRVFFFIFFFRFFDICRDGGYSKESGAKINTQNN